jgi:hypothetical protein
MEAYRAAGLLFPHERDGDDFCPDEPKPRASASPNEPEVPTGGGLDPSGLGTTGARAPGTTDPMVLRDDPGQTPNEPEAAVAVSPNEPEAAVAISPNEPEPTADVSPDEPGMSTEPMVFPAIAARGAGSGDVLGEAMARVSEELPGLWDALKLLRDRSEAGGGHPG